MLENFFLKRITPGMFRLFLALLVMVYHAVDFISLGRYAVYVFFMLSGYWIFRMYNEKYRTLQSSYIVYLRSRLFRLMPVYWCILAFSVVCYIVLAKISPAHEEPWTSGMLMHNFIIIGLANNNYALIDPSWSLDIEIQFYLVAPLLLLLFQRLNNRIILVVILAVSVLLIHQKFDELKLLIYLPYFAIGGMIYLSRYVATRRMAMICIYGMVLVLAINYCIPVLKNNYLLDRHASVWGFNYQESINALLALLTIPFVSLNVKQELTPVQFKRDHLWSSMSYVLYLLHWPLLQLYAASVEGVGIVQKFIHLFAFFGACLLLSFLISKYIDEFFEGKRKAWLKSIPRKQTAVA